MGLDMMIYKFSKIKNYEQALDAGNDALQWNAEDIDQFPFGKKWIMDCIQIDTVKSVFNEDAFENIFGFSCTDTTLLTTDSQNNTITAIKDNKNKTINYEIYKKLCFNQIPIKAYLYLQNEVDYQRKGLDDEGWTILGTIGNCVYSTDKEKIKEMTKYGLRKSFVTNMKKDCAFFAWW
jgi:hypothetical protein